MRRAGGFSPSLFALRAGAWRPRLVLCYPSGGRFVERRRATCDRKPRCPVAPEVARRKRRRATVAARRLAETGLPVREPTRTAMGLVTAVFARRVRLSIAVTTPCIPCNVGRRLGARGNSALILRSSQSPSIVGTTSCYLARRLAGMRRQIIRFRRGDERPQFFCARIDCCYANATLHCRNVSDRCHCVRA
jgi:hypothetical protein